MNTKQFPRRLFVFLLFAFCLVGFYLFINNVKSSESRRGVALVSYTRVLNESTIMQQEKKRAEKIAVLVQEARSRTQRRNYDLPEPLRREIRMIENATLSNKLRVEAGHTRMISHNTITDVVEKYRLKNHYSMVFNKDKVTISGEGQDISAAIIAELQDINIDYGELPQFNQTEQTLHP
ncbi:hypothetical protein QSX22_003753 [Salmonella enterica]|nr:hypothetical protein [Salmonella enterica]